MKQVFLSFIPIFVIGNIYSQTTFNLRERYDFLATVLTSVVPTDSGYYISGIIADTVFPYNTGAIFMKLDMDGEPLFIKTLENTEKTYEPWFNDLAVLPDGNFIVSGVTVDSVEKSLLLKYSPEGDTIFSREFFNPAYPLPYIMQPRGGVGIMPDGGLVLLNYVRVSPLGTDFYIIKTDSLGNQLWGKVFGNSMWERPTSMVVTPAGKILAGGIRTNQHTNVQNYIFRCHLFQVDGDGNQEWEWSSPLSWGLRDAANDMLLLDDGSIIVASGVGHEQQRASVNEVFFDKHVFKLNPQRELEWELTFKDPTLTWAAETTNLVQLSDGSGYILAGRYFNPPASPPYNEPIKGWLAKISPQGDSVWTRTYAYLPNYPLVHTIYDMKETPDGGLIICGQSQDWSEGANYPQQGWLLKLDEYGCLVPGCQLVDAVEQVRREIGLAIYPNPASDYLNFYLRAPAGSGRHTGQFRIISAGGAVMATFGSGAPGTTYIVPVWGWALGVYFLQYLDQDNRLLVSEKFIINR